MFPNCRLSIRNLFPIAVAADERAVPDYELTRPKTPTLSLNSEVDLRTWVEFLVRQSPDWRFGGRHSGEWRPRDRRPSTLKMVRSYFAVRLRSASRRFRASAISGANCKAAAYALSARPKS